MKVSSHGIKPNSSTLAFSATHPMFKYDVPEVPEDIARFLKKASKLVVVGMGGSVLPLQAFVNVMGFEDRVIILDSLERQRLTPLLRDKGLIFCVVSKSGETLEVKTVLRELTEANRISDCLFVTDPVKGSLRKLSTDKNVLSLPIPPELGGRFTNFSIFHRAVLERFGVNFAECLSVAKKECDRLKKNPADLGVMFDSVFARPTSSFIFWTYRPELRGLLSWAQQAIAESLGKRRANGDRVGSLPILLEGPKDQHSVLQLLIDGPQDKALWFFMPVSVGNKNVESLENIQNILAESTFKTFEERTQDAETAQPILKFESVAGIEDAVRLIVLIQAFVESAGQALGIDAFDQPGVERGKQIARELLGHQLPRS